MKYLLISLLIFSSACSHLSEDTEVKFNVLAYNLNIPSEADEFKNWSNANLLSSDSGSIIIHSKGLGELFYSDSMYIVHGYCMGEWGGALIFQNKSQLDSIAYLECTCPLMVDRRKDGFYITETLAHLDGSGKVQFLSSMNQLVSVHRDSLEGNWKKKMFPNLSNHEIWQKLENQGDVLFKTYGFTLNLLFPFNNSNYLIYSDYSHTLLAKLSSDSLIVMDTLLKSPSWRYHGDPNTINNGFYHYSFKNSNGSSTNASLYNKALSGDIYVKNDSIIIAIEEL